MAKFFVYIIFVLAQSLNIIIIKYILEMANDINKIISVEHKTYHRRLLYVSIVIMLFLVGGAAFYHYAEGWRYIDALYFATATMTTVGYGDITPQTDIGKIFTIFYVFTGVSIGLYGLSLMASHFVELREEFWLERLGRIKIKHHTLNFWEKLKGLLNYEPGKLVKGYKKSVKSGK